LAGFITTILALLTFTFAIYKWSYEEDKSRVFKKEEKIENHISILFSNGSSNEKYQSIILLGNYLDKDNKKYHSQILSSLVNYLNDEPNFRNRNSINEILNRVEKSNIKKDVLESTLTTLIELSRNKNKGYKLYNQKKTYFDIFRKIDSTSQEAIAIDIAKSITTFLKKGIKNYDLSDIYCYGCDFTNLNLPKTNFERAVLTKADFSNSNFSGSNFNDADLDETKFIDSKLVNTKFTTSYFKTENNYALLFNVRKNYVIRQLDYEDKLYQPIVKYPDFSNADLTNADFSGHLLFNFSILANDNSGGILSMNLAFNNAILTNTNFESSGIFGSTYDNINNKKPKMPVFPFSPFKGYRETHGKSGQPKEEYSLYVYQFNESLTLSENIEYFPNSIHRLIEMFDGANWKEARMPKPIKFILEEVKITGMPNEIIK